MVRAVQITLVEFIWRSDQLRGGNLNYQIVAKEGFYLLYFESQSSHI